MRFLIFYFLFVSNVLFSQNNLECNPAEITPCLITSGLVNQGGCLPVGEPYIWSGICEYGINRYISRSANMEFLSNFNHPSACWGHPNVLTQPNNAIVNCDPPYHNCSSTYCPDTYCESIRFLVESNIQFVARAANPFGNEHEFLEGGLWFNASAQMICDINAAYDCAGLRRPIIQGSILEIVGGLGNNVPIPTEIIEHFIPQMTIEERMYYLDQNENPREGLFFRRNRMSLANEDIDITGAFHDFSFWIYKHFAYIKKSHIFVARMYN